MPDISKTTKSVFSNAVTIPVITNNGREGIVVTSTHGTYLDLQGSPYWSPRDAYLHIDGRISNLETQSAIRFLNIQYFAGALRMECNGLFRRARRTIRIGISFSAALRSIFVYRGSLMAHIGMEPKKWWQWRICPSRINIWSTRTIEVVDQFDCPPLGASWQRYYEDRTWLKTAEKIKGDRIYLA